MDISKFFAENKDLGDQSNDGDEPKRFREEVQQAVVLPIHLPTCSKKV